MDQVDDVKWEFKQALFDEMRTSDEILRDGPVNSLFYNTVEHSFDQLWDKYVQPALNRQGERKTGEPIRWSIGHTKPLSEIKPRDIPRGLSAEDIATDG